MEGSYDSNAIIGSKRSIWSNFCCCNDDATAGLCLGFGTSQFPSIYPLCHVISTPMLGHSAGRGDTKRPLCAYLPRRPAWSISGMDKAPQSSYGGQALRRRSDSNSVVVGPEDPPTYAPGSFRELIPAEDSSNGEMSIRNSPVSRQSGDHYSLISSGLCRQYARSRSNSDLSAINIV